MAFAGFIAMWVLTGAPEALPAYTPRQFDVEGRNRARGPVLRRKVQVLTPSDWTPEPMPGPRSLRLYGPDGEGTLTVAVALHPSQLDPVLGELRRRHPGSVPGPPQPMSLPGLNEVLGDRATRYSVTGRQLGEMVMIERRDTIVLVAVVVRASAWEAVSPLMSEVYRSIQIHRVRPPPPSADPPRRRPDHRWQ
jgi:hypothetical protein